MKGLKLYKDVRLSTSRGRRLDRAFFLVLALASLTAITAACTLILLMR